MKTKHQIYLKIHPNSKKEFPEIEKFLKQILKLSLEYIKQTEKDHFFEISISIIDNEEIQNLNRTYRNKDKPTDVLSFSQIEGDNFPILENQPVILGDIFISYEQCKTQAIEYNHSFYEELLRLIVHGIYHLLGYDHERSKQEEKLMQKKEENLALYLKNALSNFSKP